MHFGFTLDLPDIDLWNIDLLDTHLDLLDTDIPSKHFVCLHNVLKTSSRHVFKTSLRHVFKTSSRHLLKTSSKHVFKTSWRRLQRNNFLSSKTSSRYFYKRSLRHLQDVLKKSLKSKICYAEDVLKTSGRHLGRRLEDVLRTNKCVLGYYHNFFHWFILLFLLFFTWKWKISEVLYSSNQRVNWKWTKFCQQMFSSLPLNLQQQISIRFWYKIVIGLWQ